MWTTLARKYAGNLPILEMACGTGRVTIPLAEAGFQVHGVDLSLDMLMVAKQKVGSANLSQHIELQHGNMIDYKSGIQHNFVIVPFTAFAHVPHRNHVEALENFASQLTDDGVLLVDIFNPHPDKLNTALQLDKNVVLAESNERLLRWNSSSHDTDAQTSIWSFVCEVFDLETGDSKRRYYEEENVSIVYPDQWRQRMRDAGLQIVEEWNHYDMSPFDVNSYGRMLFLAEKA